jgi:hypothetical protein
MGAPRVRPAIIEHFHAHAGKSVSISELIQTTELTTDQILPAIRAMIRQGVPITTVVPRQVWRFDADTTRPSATVTALKPKAAESPDTLFEAVGKNAKGEIIVRGDVTGSLFKVIQL